MNRNLCIGDLIEVPSVQTVIRLEDGRENPESITAGFVFTPEIETHLNIVSEALTRPHGQGFFLQGDFGSGKSHFLACLAAWLDDRPGAQRLTDQHQGLARCRQSGRRWLTVDLSLIDFRANTPLERIVVEAVDGAFAERGLESDLSPLAGFIKNLRTLLQNPALAADFAVTAEIDGREIDAFLRKDPRRAYVLAAGFMQQKGLVAPDLLVTQRRETFVRIMDHVRGCGFDGLVLLMDELSEFLRAKPDARALNEDARTLQLLGEMATDAPLWIVAAVQESIERTGDLAQVTFQKIKDRFPVKLVISSVHIRALIAGRLVRRKTGADEEILRIYNYFKQQFPSFRWDWPSFSATYPVHPVTIGLLDGLGDLFSVHRGIVDFVHAQLAGDPQRNIPGILGRPCYELLGPDSIFDHFSGRMAEVTTLNAFPRYVVPHLDEVIARVVEDPADQSLARRLVRLLVLYRIHPTAKTPDVKGLTEQVACALSDQDPDLNVQFVAEVLLDPLTAESRFLIKRPAADNDPLKAVYEVLSEEDPGKTLKAKIVRIASDLADDDTRVLAESLVDLAESISWPGPALWHNGLPRMIQWLQSSRTVRVFFVQPGAEAEQAAELTGMLKQGDIDFAVALSIGPTTFTSAHCAVWQIPFPPDEAEHGVLKEYFAVRQMLATLKPGRPSDDRVLQSAREAAQRLQPAAGQAALKTFYAGAFVEGAIAVEPVIRQLMRFERLLESAVAHLLPKRYPNYSLVAPRRMQPSPRIYQRLLDEFVDRGKMTLKEARNAQLAEAIEDLAMPLGLVEMRSGSYVLAPDPAAHGLLAALFTRINTAGPTPMVEILDLLKNGPYGLPDDASSFLLLGLAHAGLIGLMKNNRVQPLDFLKMVGFVAADAVVPGELINRHDRETLLTECAFLLPAETGGSFGLRQQRDVWQAVIQFKRRMDSLIDRITKLMAPLAQFSAFQGFDRQGLERRMAAVSALAGAVKVSYAAREGLERFLNAWRESGVSDRDVDYLKQLERFLSQRAEHYIFVNHYIQHAAVAQAAAQDEPIAELHHQMLECFKQPDTLLDPDQEHRLAETFEAFRTAYAQFYTARHDQYYQSLRPQTVARTARRALELLVRLARIEALDRPEALAPLLAATQKQRADHCQRNLAEEMMRAPLCGCGYSIDKVPHKSIDPEARIESCLQGYLHILKAPEVREALTARCFALADSQPETVRPLEQTLRLLNDPAASTAGLLDLWDERIAVQIEAALSGRYTVERRTLRDLAAKLGGRRMPTEQVMATVRQWAAPSSEKSVIAVVNDLAADNEDRQPPPAWWSWLHPELMTVDGGLDWSELESALQQQFPPDEFIPRLGRMDDRDLLGLLTHELFHTDLIRRVWQLLLDRILTAGTWPVGLAADLRSRHCHPQRAAAVDQRLDILRGAVGHLSSPFPQRLQARGGMSALLHDEWTPKVDQDVLHQKIKALQRHGDEWLQTLPELTALDLDRHPTVIVLDGVSPDVWLAAMEGWAGTVERPVVEWFRLTAEPTTVPAIAAQFGLAEDPLDALAARGIAYEHLEGNEAGPIEEYLPSLAPERTTVVRVSLLDRGAHSGTLRLHEMPAVLTGLLNAVLPRLVAQCTRHQCPVVITTDHGLSLTSKGLTHGRGGVFEQAVFRARWSFGK